jgi:DNA-binding transcriptional MerR regulator
MLNIGEFGRLGPVSPRMLRHYDEIGLLKPNRVDPQTGYRSYEVAQLGRLHRLLALRDLGFTLEQIAPLLAEDPGVEELRGMLRLRQAQIEQTVADEQARLRRVEAHLRAIERSLAMPSLDVIIKTARPVRVAAITGTAPGWGHENIGPVFEQLVPQVLGHLAQKGVEPRMMVAWYEEPADEGSIVLHVGFDIGDQQVDGIDVVELPGIEVASCLHRGVMDTISDSYEALVRWIEDSGHDIAGRSRELYLAWDNDHPDQSITELQVPIAG